MPERVQAKSGRCSEHPSVVEKKVDATITTPQGNAMVLKGSWVVRAAIHEQLQKEEFMSRAKRLDTRKFAIMFCKPCLWIGVLPSILTVCIFKFAVSLKRVHTFICERGISKSSNNHFHNARVAVRRIHFTSLTPPQHRSVVQHVVKRGRDHADLLDD